MKLVVTAAMAAAFLGACSTTTGMEAPKPVVKAAVAAPAAKVASSEEGKICKRLTVMGSNMPKRVCSTREEWDTLNKAGEEGVEDFKRGQSDAGTPGIKP